MSILTFIFVIDRSYISLFGILFAFFHEFGHIFAFCKKGFSIKKLSFGFFNIGILGDIPYESCSAKGKIFENIIVFLSGPLVNLALAIVFLIVYLVLEKNIIKLFVFQNLF